MNKICTICRSLPAIYISILLFSAPSTSYLSTSSLCCSLHNMQDSSFLHVNNDANPLIPNKAAAVALDKKANLPAP